MKLSILIPSRNEIFLKNTIEDILKNIEDDTEIIAVLDGQFADPPIDQHERVNVIYVPEAIGQRASTNLACKIAKGKYIMKIDAHCSFDKGFDRKMLEVMQDDWTMVPIMRNLWAFDWKCYKCGKRVYQDKQNICPVCNTEMKRKMLWVGKHNPQSTSFCFDKEPHFQYFEDYKHTPKYIKDKEEKKLTETMSLQGSCFMCTKEKYLELNICDEELGSWGNQGIEVACKTWLTGGKVIVNHNTWYAHMFRTKANNDFGFPYKQNGNDVTRCKAKVRKLLWKGQIPNQKYPLSWLIERFMPVPSWTKEDIKNIC